MSLLQIVERFPGLTALVLGDPMQDVYHIGRVDRLSPEAPVPIFIEEMVQSRPGGAANVNHQLERLGLETETVFPEQQMWSIKHRFMVEHHQMFRWDQDCHTSLDFEDEAFELDDIDVVVISDYAKGMCGPMRCENLLLQSRDMGVPSVVDPKGINWGKYGNASVICPNIGEWRAMTSFPSGARPWFPKVVRKRGAQGLEIWDGDNRPEMIAAQAQRVFDVTGAGDTVTAVLAACLAAGADLVEAAMLANLAAGYVVGQVGTTVCSLDALKLLADRYDHAHRVC